MKFSAWLASLLLSAGGVALAGICDRPDGVTCLNPPYQLEDIHNFGGNTIMSYLANRPGSQTVYVAGVNPGRYLHRSQDGGRTWETTVSFKGTVTSISSGPNDDEIFVGSMYQDVPIFPTPANSSYLYSYDFTNGNNGEWVGSSLDGFPSKTRVVSLSQKGLHYSNNGTLYAGLTVQYPATQNPYLEYFIGISGDNGATFDLVPFLTQEYQVFGIRMLDGENGVAIAGQHWEGDYSDPGDPEIIAEYVAIVAVTSDGGRTWSETFHHEKLFTFVDIDCKGTTCWAVGTGLGYSITDNVAKIFQSTDGGENWVEQFSTINSPEFDGGIMFVSVHFVDSNFGYVVGNLNLKTVVMVTFDGGAQWHYAFEPAADFNHLVYDVFDQDGVLYILSYDMLGFETHILRMNAPAGKN